MKKDNAGSFRDKTFSPENDPGEYMRQERIQNEIPEKGRCMSEHLLFGKEGYGPGVGSFHGIPAFSDFALGSDHMGGRGHFYEKRPGAWTKRIDVFLLKWYGKKKLFLIEKGRN